MTVVIHHLIEISALFSAPTGELLQTDLIEYTRFSQLYYFLQEGEGTPFVCLCMLLSHSQLLLI